jgi:N-acetyl-alpha-D-glucosaminyl L-malate synthase BshA
MANPLRIGITCYPTFGGSGVVATELGVALAQLGHEVHFITSRLPARLRASNLLDISFHEVSVYNYALFEHAPYDLALAAKMAEVAETFSLDILHVHYAIPHAISAHLAQEMLGGAVKVVTTLHGTDITLVGNDPSLSKITRFAINQADAVTAVSQWLKDETQREFSPKVPVHVIRNFVDTRQFNPELASQVTGRQYGCGSRRNIIHVSNFRPVKRAPEVVEIFAKVAQHHDACLLMVGDGPDLHRAVKAAKQHGVTDRVHFLGNREDVAYLLAVSEILVLPSESESFGLAALEAMASGCAVVCSDIGGLPELVRDGVDGYLCALGDVDGMAGRVDQLLRDESLLTRIQASAKNRAASEFATSVVVEEYLLLYRSVLESAPRSVR